MNHYGPNDLVAAGLLGGFITLATFFFFVGIVTSLGEWRRAFREGTPLNGVEFERNRRREESR